MKFKIMAKCALTGSPLGFARIYTKTGSPLGFASICTKMAKSALYTTILLKQNTKTTSFKKKLLVNDTVETLRWGCFRKVT